MRKRIIVTLLFAVLALAGIAANAGKITICHVPPGNPANAHTITISRNAWENGHSPHNAHALDYEGACEIPEPTATRVEPSRTPVPTKVWPTETETPRRNPTATPTFDHYATAIPVCGTESACDLCEELNEMNYNLGRIADALEAANE
jgi:hypothetical protein